MIIFKLYNIFLYFIPKESSTEFKIAKLPCLLFLFGISFSLTFVNFLLPQQFLFGANVNGPLFTKYTGIVEGSDLFKMTVGLTNLTVDKGLVKVCVKPSENPDHGICNITNITEDYEKDFPLKNCPSCIITMGTFVFPKQYVPENTQLDVCGINLNNQLFSCVASRNTESKKVEDVVIHIK